MCLRNVVIFFLLAGVNVVLADVSLNALFSDGMVIQRDSDAPVWGWAEPGETVTVSGSWGSTEKTVTRSDGRWGLRLRTPKAGGPFTMTVAGKNKLTIKDLYSGEVWFCSGQSNMAETMKSMSADAPEEKYQPIVEAARKEMKTSNDPLLRQIRVPCHVSLNEPSLNFRGTWKPNNPANNPDFSGVAHFFGKELRKELDVPVGLILCSWGATRVQPWISEAAYQEDADKKDYFKKEIKQAEKDQAKWSPEKAQKQYKRDLAKWEREKKGRAPRKPEAPEKNKNLPSTLFNGMVSSVIPYQIRGVIWYQGESNDGYLDDEYSSYYEALVSGWREAWGQDDFPFYSVQLASWRRANSEPVEIDGWATIRDQQRRSLTIPNTGMAVAIDIGEARNIHPRNKMDVGQRLALWALGHTYEVDVPIVSGPMYKTHTIQKKKIRIQFDYAGSGLMAGHKELLAPAEEVSEPLERFEIRGDDGEWKWAEATIVGKNIVEVSHPSIRKPKAVRYAWSANPAGILLYNKEGLPASPFTTE